VRCKGRIVVCQYYGIAPLRHIRCDTGAACMACSGCQPHIAVTPPAAAFSAHMTSTLLHISTLKILCDFIGADTAGGAVGARLHGSCGRTYLASSFIRLNSALSTCADTAGGDIGAQLRGACGGAHRPWVHTIFRGAQGRTQRRPPHQCHRFVCFGQADCNLRAAALLSRGTSTLCMLVLQDRR
jgi:hypothetical protein